MFAEDYATGSDLAFRRVALDHGVEAAWSTRVQNPLAVLFNLGQAHPAKVKVGRTMLTDEMEELTRPPLMLKLDGRYLSLTKEEQEQLFAELRTLPAFRERERLENARHLEADPSVAEGRRLALAKLRDRLLAQYQ